MKANELMIGDIVQYNGMNIRVQSIDRGNVSYHCGYQCGIYELEPIPLTDKILKDNNLAKYGNSYTYFGYDQETGEMMDCVKVDFSKENGRILKTYILANKLKPYPHDCNIYIAIGYVHEFQHALRLCGLNEMADEFVVY